MWVADYVVCVNICVILICVCECCACRCGWFFVLVWELCLLCFYCVCVFVDVLIVCLVFYVSA